MTMKSEQLKESLKKATEKAVKIETTLGKHIIKADKMKIEIESKGWDCNDVYCREGQSDYNDSYWLICDYKSKLEDIKSCTRKLEDAQIVVNNWAEKLDKQLNFENVYTYEMPEVFKQCQEDLCNQWTEYDIKRRDNMFIKKRELSYQDFSKLFDFSQFMALNISDEQIVKNNMREATLWIVDLYNRIKAITGEVVDYSQIRFNGKALNGYVKGENGTVEVETIQAGGYNIQRLHLRVLVKKM